VVIWLLEKRSRIIAAGIIAVVGPLLGLSVYVYAHVTSEFARIVVAENETLLNLASYHVEEKINNEIASAKTFADRPLLIAAVQRNDTDAMRGHLRNFIGNSLTIERVIVTTPQGIGVAAYPDDQDIKSLDFTDRDWYRGVSARWTPYVSDFSLTAAEPKKYLFSIAIPIMEQAGDVAGILVIQPRENYFMDVVSGMRIGKGFIYIVDKNGALVYHPEYKLDKVIDFSGLPAVEQVKKGIQGSETSEDPLSKELVISVFQPMKWGWGLIMQRPREEALQPIKSMIAGLLIFAGIAVFTGVIMAIDGMELLYSTRELSLKLQEREKTEREIKERLQVELAERKAAEEKLVQTLADLERSNKELEQFAYVASHDLQEPLRKVGSFTELLERRFSGQMGPDADRYMGYIVDGARRMSMLITDLLAFSRIGTSTRVFAGTDLNQVLRRTLDDLQHRIQESGAEVTYDDLPLLMADESQLGMVFQNLISNAIKFHGEEKPRIHVSAREEGGRWLFSVSDNGIGIEADYRDRIFMMFQRLHSKSDYPGTGIGLAICKKVVERHGGRIWVESEFGKGSTFYFKI
jgi:signal transduction histidine kinase